jgi:hypothetical protein
MPNVVVAGGIIQCSHGGQIQFSGGASQLQVSGSGVITSGMEASLSFAQGAPGVTVPCPEMTKPPPPATPVPSPCASSPATAGVATLLMVGGAGALLSSAQGPCVNPASSAPPTWSIASPGETLLSVAS